MISTIILYFYMIKNKYKNINKIIIFSLFLDLIFIKYFKFSDYIILTILYSISVIDINERIIPNFYILMIFIITIIFGNIKLLYLDFSISDFVSILIILILFLISLFTENIGMGDVKLFLVLYFYLKGEDFNSLLFIISFITFIYSIIYLFLYGNKKHSFPFVPFISISFLILRSFL